jgi:hypothetical protein
MRSHSFYPIDARIARFLSFARSLKSRDLCRICAISSTVLFKVKLNLIGKARQDMNRILRLQLSVMMFVQFFVWGAWYVTAPNYLGTIGFTATDFAWTFAVGPIAGMISPFFV